MLEVECHRGKTSTCEQKDNCPTITYQKMFPHSLGTNNVNNLLSKK